MLKTTTSKLIFSIAILLTSINATKAMNPFDKRSMPLHIPNIKESELQNVENLSNEKIETYHLRLTNGNEISANCFRSGPSKGEICCIRTRRGPNSHSVQELMNSQLFHILKNIAENKQSVTPQEKSAN